MRKEQQTNSQAAQSEYINQEPAERARILVDVFGADPKKAAETTQADPKSRMPQRRSAA